MRLATDAVDNCWVIERRLLHCCCVIRLKRLVRHFLLPGQYW